MTISMCGLTNLHFNLVQANGCELCSVMLSEDNSQQLASNSLSYNVGISNPL